MSTMAERIGSDIYQGTADLGRVMSLVSAVMITAAGAIVMGMGIYNLKYPPPVDPTKPNQLSPKQTAMIMIGGSALFIAFSWFWVWITRKSKAAAAFGGVSNIMGLFRV